MLNETKCFYTWYPRVSLSFTLNAFINPQAFNRSHTHRHNIKSHNKAQVSVEKKKKKKRGEKRRKKGKRIEKERGKRRKEGEEEERRIELQR